MKADKIAERNLYYTNDHEWIDYQGTVSYVGVCNFKLKGIKNIDQLKYKNADGIRRQGEIIATIKYADYLIPVNMPVSGRVFQFNKELLLNSQNIVLIDAETHAWIALIIPLTPHDRNSLMLPQQYKMNVTKKSA